MAQSKAKRLAAARKGARTRKRNAVAKAKKGAGRIRKRISASRKGSRRKTRR